MRSQGFLTVLFAVLLTMLTMPASAFDRAFPPMAKRGTLSPARHPEVMIDGKKRSLSPGARIWNQENLIEVPAAMQGGDLVVNYTEDDQGAIDRIWILTRDEASKTLPKK
jgi:hypothetical protein